MKSSKKVLAFLGVFALAFVVCLGQAHAALPDLGVDADVVITDVTTAYGPIVNTIMGAALAIAIGWAVLRRVKKVF